MTNVFRRLRRHLNTLPVGFPATISRVELRILKYLFTPGEAEIVQWLSAEFRSVPEIFASRPAARPDADADLDVDAPEKLERALSALARRGLVFEKHDQDGVKYANAPFVIGMFELNLHNLSHAFLKDVETYMKQGYALEMVNSQVPQLRTVPVEESVPVDNIVLAHDEVRHLLESSPGPFAVAECICKKSHDIDEDACQVTNLRETCINMGMMGRMYLDNGIGREITREEAQAIIQEAERAGLVIQSMNAQEPQVICACCGCCCGVLTILQRLPRPAEFVSSTYHADLDPAKCTGCGTCASRCQVKAITWTQGAPAELVPGRCIGCGLCVVTCPTGALTLVPRAELPAVPRDRAELYQTIEEHKKSRWQRIKLALKILLRRK